MIMTTHLFVRLTTLVAASLLATPVASADVGVPPAPPSSLVAAASAPGEISLAWNASTSLVGVASYRIYHVLFDGSLALVAEVAADVLAWTETGIAPGTTVTYAVTATDLVLESAPSNAASATTWTVPTAPRDVAASSGPGLVGEATITWSAPESDGGAPVLAYHVYRDGALVASMDGATFSWTEGGLTPLHAYVYHVTASNVVGEGATSEAACGMASPTLPEFGCASVL